MEKLRKGGDETMIINKKLRCPWCGAVVEGIKDSADTFQGYCDHCHDWWRETEDNDDVKDMH